MAADGFARTLDGFEAVLAGVAPDRWDAPSPCSGWYALDVAGHVIANLLALEAFAAGVYEEEPADPRSAAGNDPLAAWRLARAAVPAALSPAALARIAPLPSGPVPLSTFLEQHAPMEILVHTWDLAQATGQAVALDPGLVRDALGPARQFAPMARILGLIGPECTVAEDADDLTRLLAILGRHNTRRAGFS
jgi:uncharacterized protein (TIGR03086 family)